MKKKYTIGLFIPLVLFSLFSCNNNVNKEDEDLKEKVEERTLNFYAVNDFHGSYLYDESYSQTGLSRIGKYLIDEKTKDTILNVLHTYKEIKAINDISSAPVGYQYVLFLTIAVDGNMTTFQSHKLADKLEKDMTKLDNVYKAIIHIEPYLK